MTDTRIQYTEYMVGAGHPTLTDTLNRLCLVEHNSDGTHKNIIISDTGQTTTSIYLRATHATYTGTVVDIGTSRTDSTAYQLLQITNNNSGSAHIKLLLTGNGILSLDNSVITGAGGGDLVMKYNSSINTVNYANAGMVQCVHVGESSTTDLAEQDILMLGMTSGADIKIHYAPAANIVSGNAFWNGLLMVDSTNNRLCYFSGGNRYYLAGTSF